MAESTIDMTLIGDTSPPRGESAILILSGVRGDTRRYRTIHPYEQLRLAGADCFLSHITDPEVWTKAWQASLVIIHRVAWNPTIERQFRSLRARGVLAIFDTDDLVFDPTAFCWIDSPDFQDPLRVELYQEEMHRYRTTLESCQAVMASTQYLADHARELGKPVWVHRNAFSLEMLERSQAALQGRYPAREKVIMGYASGTPTHNRDFAVAKLALLETLRRYPQVELWLVGPLDPGRDWGKLEDRVRRIGHVPWRKLPGVLAQFDINIAPLVADNPFGQSKSEIKYVEAGLVKVPTVATPTESFRFAIRPGENGYLAGDDAEWMETLAALVEHPDLRRALGEEAYQDVIQRYHPRVRSAELVETLDQISLRISSRPFWIPAQSEHASADDPQAVVRASRIDPRIEHNPTLLRMAFHSLRYRGLGTLLKQVRVYLRRLAVPLFPYRTKKD